MLRESLRRTREALSGRLAALTGKSEITEDTWDELEASLLQADLGLATTLALVKALRARVQKEGIAASAKLDAALKEELLRLLPPVNPTALSAPRLLTVVLIVGVNGSGKTTTIGKLARKFKGEGWDVLLAAGDTFRAAAIEQLQEWGRRVDVPVIAGQSGGDPGAVAYDAVQAARARGCNLLIVDTAGRLHTKFNLMEELKKVSRVLSRNVHEAPHEVWLVVDGTTGQNALTQARHFKQAIGVTGVVITKLDSTARGGMIFAIGHELGLPVRFVGVGERDEALVPFDPVQFVDGLFEN
ncbi:MAG: signal recognition particle-docking protein FtsY [Anaerolineae bacterium]|nr:signal recognition particle-docking protein FtsY [Anaerolineae bacterium]